MAKNTGGSAFPDPGRAQSAKQRLELTGTGITTRDYFATEAIGAVFERCIRNWDHICPEACEQVASSAYMLADAMLKERDRG